MKRFTRYKLVV